MSDAAAGEASLSRWTGQFDDAGAERAYVEDRVGLDAQAARLHCLLIGALMAMGHAMDRIRLADAAHDDVRDTMLALRVVAVVCGVVGFLVLRGAESRRRTATVVAGTYAALLLIYSIVIVTYEQMGVRSGQTLYFAIFALLAFVAQPGGFLLGALVSGICVVSGLAVNVVFAPAPGADQLRFLATVLGAWTVGAWLTATRERVRRHAYLAQAAAEARSAQLEREKDALREQLEVSQRMEAVGRLAGGTAHDFNNALTVIMGWVELLQHSADPQLLATGLDAMRQATSQAAGLTRQLLSLSRHDVHDPQLLEPKKVVEDAIRMVRPSLPKDIRVRVEGSSTGQVHADEGQLHQVLLNLAINARDAMPAGGELLLSVREVHGAILPDLAGGDYVVIDVTDTGSGMDEDTRRRAFEPFFTTKQPGQGTGLGLSVAYGIVRKSGGVLAVQSAPGEGTTFCIYLPVAEGAPSASPAPAVLRSAQAKRCVLVVEDSASVRDVMVRALRQGGYEVLEAADGDSAAEVIARRAGDIDLLCSDGIMPGMGTRALIGRFRDVCPEGRVLLCSGYLDDDLVAREIDGGLCDYLPKPFTGGELLERVDILLRADGTQSAPQGSAGGQGA